MKKVKTMGYIDDPSTKNKRMFNLAKLKAELEWRQSELKENQDDSDDEKTSYAHKNKKISKIQSNKLNRY